ncbi:hypothetical protein DY000_02007870 [Brassica cretica]|uniref:Uncharacterized protein n=1 Tax=Brassica cretica TaxID=69181 RepID=A0ABQ7BYB6_BRACR|nr:hypothetical protein DY000_02007870 [Brassica cretica]
MNDSAIYSSCMSMLVSVNAIFISCFPVKSFVAAVIISSLSKLVETVDRWLVVTVNRCLILCFCLRTEKISSRLCNSVCDVFRDVYNSSIQGTCLSF